MMILVLAQLLFFALPRPVLHYVVTNNAGWLLNDRERATNIPERMAQIFTGELVQQSMISHFHDRHSKEQWKDDAAYAGMLLHKLRPALISQLEIYHKADRLPTAIAGLGWCDELNGVGGRLLAHDFDKVEIVGVYDRELNDGHSFGRFWSEQYSGWLYFDIWTEEVQVFRVLPNAKAEYLYRSRPVGPKDVKQVPFSTLAKFHGGANKGFVHARHADTVAGFLASRTINFFSHGSPLPRESLAPIEAMKARKKAAPSSSRVAPRHQTKQIGHFAEARLAQMLGDYKTAQHHYRLVARSDAASSYGLAAAKFLDNPVP
ncbi:hypothetical protein [Sphingorhabdus sp.]|uniref:hypothetical protein n=3 Tax=Sphingorhabdus sp. TaxID=1902408 RepID=UPI003C731290